MDNVDASLLLSRRESARKALTSQAGISSTLSRRRGLEQDYYLATLDCVKAGVLKGQRLRERKRY